MAKAPPTLVATGTLAILRAAEARGVATDDLLAEAGFTREFFEDPDARLPGPAALRIWSALRERSGDPVLHLSAPSFLPFGAYKVIDYIVASSATVGEGVQRFQRFFGLIADAVSLSLHEAPGERILALHMADGTAASPIFVEYVFAALVVRIRMRIRPDLRVARLELRQPAPPAAGQYETLFGAAVHFGAGNDRLVFSADTWAAPTLTADAALVHLLEEHGRMLEARRPRAAAGLRTDVERRIAAAPADGASANAVARALNVSVRTLQRKLVADGTTFAEVSNAVRGDLAVQYLADPKVSIAEVAFLLGFSDETSFNRAFRRWTGEPPGRWRRRRTGMVQ